MKLIQLINARQTIDGFASEPNLSAKLAYDFTKFVIKTQAEADSYVAAIRVLIEKYKNPDGGEIKIAPEHAEEFNKAVEELESTEVEKPELSFPLSEINKCLNMSMKQMYAIMDFIDEDK